MSLLDNRKQLDNKQQGILVLFFIQVFSTLSFSVLYSTLVLFMTSKLNLPQAQANSITGVFVALNFALHLLGGYLGGRLMSNRALFCLGMGIQVVGCLFLARQNITYLYYGLAAFLTGCGLNVTCINCMLTQRFQPKDTRRETAFLWIYAGMNIGFFVGFSLSGYFQLSLDYQRLFIFSSLGNLIALILCLYFWSGLADQKTSYSQLGKKAQRKASYWGLGIVFLLAIVLSQLLPIAAWVNKLILVSGLIILATACWLAYQQNTRDAREKILAFAVLMVVSTVFWTLYQTGPMGLTNFIAHNVDRRWLTRSIPPQWFQNINTLCIVLGGPALSFLLNHLRSRGIKINIPTQFACALVLIGLAFAILPLGIAGADKNGMVSQGWIVWSFILQSAGELLISPIGYAMIGALAPHSLQGVMMGMWMLASGVGATLSSYSSNWMIAGQDGISPLATNSSYSQVFLELGVFSIVAALVLLVLTSKLKAWMADKEAKSLPDEPLSIRVFRE